MSCIDTEKVNAEYMSVGAPLAGALIPGTRKGCPYELLLIIMFIDKCKEL
jgi:hypothetical protein